MHFKHVHLLGVGTIASHVVDLIGMAGGDQAEHDVRTPRCWRPTSENNGCLLHSGTGMRLKTLAGCGGIDAGMSVLQAASLRLLKEMLFTLDMAQLVGSSADREASDRLQRRY